MVDFRPAKDEAELKVVNDVQLVHATSCQSSIGDVAGSDAEMEIPPDLGDRYEVLDLLGSGGMGTVWKVHDNKLDEDFAVKVLKGELLTDEVAKKRFQREAELASELTHANIAATFGYGFDGIARPYILMRYVDGESLSDILNREGPLPEERAIDIFVQLCEGMSHSHMKGIVHRDIKPGNIVVSKTESGADLVQLVDFGIANCIYEVRTKTMALTSAVDVLGSPRYMSPEQLRGEEVTVQSDIYSLACVFYEMLTGKPPFTEENPVKLILQHISEPVDLSSVPFKYRDLLFSCLAKDPARRPPSCDYVIVQLCEVNLEPQKNPEFGKSLPGLMAAVFVLSGGLTFGLVPYALPILGFVFLYLLVINQECAAVNIEYRRAELCLLCVIALQAPFLFLAGFAPGIWDNHLLAGIVAVLAAASLAAWLTINDGVFAAYLRLVKRVNSGYSRPRSRIGAGLITIRCLCLLIGASPFGYLSSLSLLNVFAGLSVGVPLSEAGAAFQFDFSLFLCLNFIFCLATICFDSMFSQPNYRASAFRAIKWCSSFYLVGLVAGGVAVAVRQEPGLMEYLQQKQVAKFARRNPEKYKAVRLAALNYPDTPMGNKAKLLAAFGMSNSADGVVNALALYDQVINSGKLESPEVRAQALIQRINLTGMQSAYPGVIASQLDRVLDELAQVKVRQEEIEVGDTGNPGWMALVLAEFASEHNDQHRVAKALAVASKWAVPGSDLANFVEHFSEPGAKRLRMYGPVGGPF
ncbi:MAG: serine/threonine-protein kinase [Candidatus Obscuribacter sp.]|nr:serine/threonine-protein kinase [Candidatus Obscuribacter sp.]